MLPTPIVLTVPGVQLQPLLVMSVLLHRNQNKTEEKRKRRCSLFEVRIEYTQYSTINSCESVPGLEYDSVSIHLSLFAANNLSKIIKENRIIVERRIVIVTYCPNGPCLKVLKECAERSESPKSFVLPTTQSGLRIMQIHLGLFAEDTPVPEFKRRHPTHVKRKRGSRSGKQIESR